MVTFKGSVKKAEYSFNHKKIINLIVAKTADAIGTFCFLFSFGLILDGLQIFLKMFSSYPKELQEMHEILEDPSFRIFKLQFVLEKISNVVRHCFTIAGVGLGLILALILTPICYITGIGRSKEADYAIWELVLGRPVKAGIANSPLDIVDRKLYFGSKFAQNPLLFIVFAIAVSIYFNLPYIILAKLSVITAVGFAGAFLGLLVGVLEGMNVLDCFILNNNIEDPALFKKAENFAADLVHGLMGDHKQNNAITPSVSLLSAQVQATINQFNGLGLWIYLSDDASKFRKEFANIEREEEIKEVAISPKSRRKSVADRLQSFVDVKQKTVIVPHKRSSVNLDTDTHASRSPSHLQHVIDTAPAPTVFRNATTVTGSGSGVDSAIAYEKRTSSFKSGISNFKKWASKGRFNSRTKSDES